MMASAATLVICRRTFGFLMQGDYRADISFQRKPLNLLTTFAASFFRKMFTMDLQFRLA